MPNSTTAATTTPPVADFGTNRLLIVKVHESTIRERGSLYEAARKFWAVSPVRAQDRPVLAMSLEDKTVLEAYRVTEWHVVRTTEMKNGRQKHDSEFTGTPADPGSWLGALVGKLVPDEYARDRAIVRYVN